MRTKLRNRDEIAQWMVSIYQDAIASYYTHDVLLTKFDRVYQSRDWKKLTQRDREYIRGYSRCYDVMIIQRLTESGSWVIMPDGSEVYFGVRERLCMSNAQLDKLYPMLKEYGIHRYIHEHQIPEKSGIYWGTHNHGQELTWDGKHPMFIPTLHSTK